MNSSSPRTESSTAAFSYRPSLNSTRLHGALIRYLLDFEPGVRKATDEEPWASKLLKPVAAEQHQRQVGGLLSRTRDCDRAGRKHRTRS